MRQKRTVWFYRCCDESEASREIAEEMERLGIPFYSVWCDVNERRPLPLIDTGFMQYHGVPDIQTGFLEPVRSFSGRIS